jgi:hypothetical protein
VHIDKIKISFFLPTDAHWLVKKKGIWCRVGNIWWIRSRFGRQVATAGGYVATSDGQVATISVYVARFDGQVATFGG